MDPGIDMTGQMVGTVQVLERSDRSNGRGAFWACLCLTCKWQFFERGTTLRSAQKRGKWAAGCFQCKPRGDAA